MEASRKASEEPTTFREEGISHGDRIPELAILLHLSVSITSPGCLFVLFKISL
jgi:hypothetical protein